MIDVWLIFTLFLPFMEVLLHTYMDYLRLDEEREINHHGTSIKAEPENTMTDETPVNSFEQNKVNPLDLISRNEETQVNALKEHYDRMKKEKLTRKNLRKLAFCRKITIYYNPIAVTVFVSFYWIIGLRQAEFF